MPLVVPPPCISAPVGEAKLDQFGKTVEPLVGLVGVPAAEDVDVELELEVELEFGGAGLEDWSGDSYRGESVGETRAR